MKKYVLLALAGLPATVMLAQAPAKKKPVAAAPKKTTTTAAPVAPVLKNSADSFSYAIGLSIASFYKAQGISNINNTLVLKALSDAKVDKPLLNETQVNNCIVNYMQNARTAKAGPNKKAGEAFLAENKKQAISISGKTGLFHGLKFGARWRQDLHLH